jgi:O-methyltransferase
MTVKQFLKTTIQAAGFEVRRLPRADDGAAADDIPDAALYQPVFSPWRSPAFAAKYAPIAPYTLVAADRCHILCSLADQASGLPGEVWECGVYRGGTAMLLADRLAATGRTLRLFDTFEGMPETNAARDWHKPGDFKDTSIESVRSRVNGAGVQFHKGLIPETFRGLESSRIAFAHVDVDIYSAVRACCEFIFPRLSVGGIMVFDDYGYRTCPGARAAVDEFFRGQLTVPLVLPTGQAIVFKSFA